MSRDNRKNEGVSGDIAISKSLSRILRHQAESDGLRITPEGFVLVEELLRHKYFKGRVTPEDVKRVVENNDKQRFALKETNEGLQIRANQGHSIEIITDLELKEISEVGQVRQVIHGTYYGAWKKIKLEGLSRMKRNHIHFTEGLIGVKSGIRRNCQTLIYINLEKALQSGIKFFKSTNNVILSPGDSNGFIKPVYFLKVIDASNGNELAF